ncbi:MAG: hypothetical protein ACYTGS_00550 [Planctomycetota bacterium]|jgi:hypothetical protein
MKKYFTLIDIEHDLGVPIEELIQYAAHNELTIIVIAQDWSASSTNGLADTVLTGPVGLVADDLLRSLGADHTTVRKVKVTDTEGFVTLDAPEEVLRGAHFVSADELKRFRAKHAKLKPEQELAVPPYLNPSYPIQSDELQIAIRAWTTLYVDGGYNPKGLGHKTQIEAWLRKHYPKPKLTETARKRIATVVNPNKTGGNPITKKD